LRSHRGALPCRKVAHVLGLQVDEPSEAIQRLPGVCVRRIGPGVFEVSPESPLLGRAPQQDRRLEIEIEIIEDIRSVRDTAICRVTGEDAPDTLRHGLPLMLTLGVLEQRWRLERRATERAPA